MLSIASILFFTNCQKDFSPGSLSGTVTNSVTGKPIEGVSIISNPLIGLILTNSSGMYSVSGVDGGVYTLTASKDEYSSESMNVTIDGEAVTANFLLDELPLNAGSAKIDCKLDGNSWYVYTPSGSCTKSNSDYTLVNKWTTGGNSYTLKIFISNTTGIGSVNIGTGLSSYIKYDRTLMGFQEHYSSQEQGCSGKIVIEYFNASTKTIRGTFYGKIKETDSYADFDVTDGTFKGTWQ
jgi:hypothetical protein